MRRHTVIALVVVAICCLAFVPGRKRGGGGGTPAPDWTASFVAVWLLEESSGTRLNESATTCGSDCNFGTLLGSPSQDATNYVEGSASVVGNRADGADQVLCTESVCNELKLYSPVSWGGWYRQQQNGNNTNAFQAKAYSSPYRGYSLSHFRWGSPNHHYECTVEGITTTMSTGSALNTWEHRVCTYQDDADDELNAYRNAVLNATPSTGAVTAGGGSYDPIGIGGGWGLGGGADEQFVISVELSAEQICRIVSCQIDGSLCTCSGASYTDDGRHTTMSLSCTLPACDSAAP